MAGLKLDTVITNIAALSVTLKNTKALKILKDSTIPESAKDLGGVLFPKPDGFVTDFTAVPVTYGASGVERMDVSYTLTYVFCDIPMGANRTIGVNYNALCFDVVQILNKILTNDEITGGVDLRVAGIGNFGAVSDPSGNMFFGTEIQLAVQEMYEV